MRLSVLALCPYPSPCGDSRLVDDVIASASDAGVTCVALACPDGASATSEVATGLARLGLKFGSPADPAERAGCASPVVLSQLAILDSVTDHDDENGSPLIVGARLAVSPNTVIDLVVASHPPDHRADARAVRSFTERLPQMYDARRPQPPRRRGPKPIADKAQPEQATTRIVIAACFYPANADGHYRAELSDAGFLSIIPDGVAEPAGGTSDAITVRLYVRPGLRPGLLVRPPHAPLTTLREYPAILAEFEV
ncbi:MAG: hypothetical protein EA382_12685 [Spirochaetaceae bacterium]|nr:MAG: hypothetical protein EA382_12685 [Spirochaetaceae bacterium]